MDITKYIATATLFIATLCTFTGCGGGGGDDSDVPVYTGAWSGSVSLVSNSCPRSIPDEFNYIYLLHNVNQAVTEDSSGNRSIEIVLDDGTDTYTGLGQLDQNGNGHSFSVTGAPHELPGFLSGYTCIEIIDFDYDSIDFSSDTAGFVRRHSSITCSRGTAKTTCDVTYTGSSYRTANPAHESTNTTSSEIWNNAA